MVPAADSVVHVQLAVALVVVGTLRVVDAATELEVAKLEGEAYWEVYLAVDHEAAAACSRRRSTDQSHDTVAAVGLVDGKLCWLARFLPLAEVRQELALDDQVVGAVAVGALDFLSDFHWDCLQDYYVLTERKGDWARAIGRTRQHRRTRCRRKDFLPSPRREAVSIAEVEDALDLCHQEADHLDVELLKEADAVVQKGCKFVEVVAVQTGVPCRSSGRHKGSLGHDIGGSSSPREASVTNE